jgi:MFS transporter, DHA1 family, tetracycline resistance protein
MTSRRAVAFVWVTVLLDMVGLGLIVPVLPSILEELTGQDAAGASRWGGWLLFSYAAMQFVFAPIVGAVSDAVGRRPVLLLSVLGLGLDYGVTALAPTLAWLFFGRIVAGLFGASYTTATAYIADVTEPEERGKAFGILGAAFGVGFTLGPAIGGLLGSFGPRMPFYVASGLSLANFFYGLVFLPETLPKEKRARFSLKTSSPLRALKDIPGGRAARVLALVTFALFLSHTVYPAIWSFWTTARFGWSPRTIGISLAAYGIVSSITQAAMVAPMIRHWGERRAAIIAMAIDAAMLAATGLATKGWIVIAIVIVGAPAGVAPPALNAWMSRSAPADAQGRLQGTIGALEGLSSIAGPLLMTQLFGAFEERAPGAPFFAAALLVLIGLALTRRAPA